MLIGGLQKFSLLDYPGRVSAIIFTQGCNFRCGFCYNPMLVWPLGGDELEYAQKESIGQQKVHPLIKPDELFVFLKSRAGKLDAVVITGGEPTLQKDLVSFIKKIKTLGYLVKLDTNGSNSRMLERLIEEKLIDYLAMDLKAPLNKYEEVAGLKVSGLVDKKLFNNIQKSVKIIMASGLAYEFRTTVAPILLNKDDIGRMGEIIKGADRWYLQNFKSKVDLVNQALKGRVPYNARQMREMAEIGRRYVKICEVR